MGASPLLDATHLIWAAEDVAVAVLAEPAPLAGGLAGLLAGRLGAVALAIRGTGIRHEELATATALATTGRAAHREPDAPEGGGKRNGRRRRRRRRETKKEEGLWRGRAGRRRPEENGISNRRNHPTFIPPLTEVAEKLATGLELEDSERERFLIGAARTRRKDRLINEARHLPPEILNYVPRMLPSVGIDPSKIVGADIWKSGDTKDKYLGRRLDNQYATLRAAMTGMGNYDLLHVVADGERYVCALLVVPAR